MKKKKNYQMEGKGQQSQGKRSNSGGSHEIPSNCCFFSINEVFQFLINIYDEALSKYFRRN